MEAGRCEIILKTVFRLEKRKRELSLPIQEGRPISIGSEGSGIILRDSQIEKRHSACYLRQGKLYIQDLNSQSGTFLNHHRITKEELKPGDTIRIGPYEIEILTLDHREQASDPLFTPDGKAVIEGTNTQRLQNIVPFELSWHPLSAVHFYFKFLKHLYGFWRHPVFPATPNDAWRAVLISSIFAATFNLVGVWKVQLASLSYRYWMGVLLGSLVAAPLVAALFAFLWASLHALFKNWIGARGGFDSYLKFIASSGLILMPLSALVFVGNLAFVIGSGVVLIWLLGGFVKLYRPKLLRIVFFWIICFFVPFLMLALGPRVAVALMTNQFALSVPDQRSITRLAVNPENIKFSSRPLN